MEEARIDVLESRITHLESEHKSSRATGQVLRTIASIVGGSLVIVTWSMCQRTLESEDATRLNTHRITDVESRLGAKEDSTTSISRDQVTEAALHNLERKIDLIDREGTQPRMAAENKIADLQRQYQALAVHVEDYFNRGLNWKDQTNKEIGQIREALAKDGFKAQ